MLTTVFRTRTRAGYGLQEAGTYGFSLVELLIVISILSILTSIATFNFLEADTRAKTTRTRADMQTLFTALVAYSSDYSGSFPPAPNDPSVQPLWQGSQEFLDNGGFHLTTPIVYLVSIPQAVYLDPSRPKLPGSGLYYFNYRYHYKLNQTAASYEKCPFADEFVANGVDWVLWSLGPALGNPGSDFGVTYDPTNGNVSRGRVATFADKKGHPDIYSFSPP